MECTLKVLKERRGIKNYKPDFVKQEDIEKIVEAGTYAACGRGLQATQIVVVNNNKELRDSLMKLNAGFMPAGYSGDPFYGAPTIAIVFADSTVGTWVEDGSLVMGNMMIAAHAIGVGSRWIHRAREMFASEEGKALKKAWGVPDSYEGIGNCILGYAEGELPAPAERKENFVIYAK